MAQDFAVVLAGLLRVAGDLGDNGSRLGEVLGRLDARLGEQGPAWGDDEAGREFEKGYSDQGGFVRSNVDAKKQLLDGYGESLRSAADSFGRHD